MASRLRRSMNPGTKQLAIDDLELHGGCTPVEPIEMLFECERSTLGSPEGLEHAVASLHHRIGDRNTVSGLAVDQDHGR